MAWPRLIAKWSLPAVHTRHDRLAIWHGGWNGRGGAGERRPASLQEHPVDQVGFVDGQFPAVVVAAVELRQSCPAASLVDLAAHFFGATGCDKAVVFGTE